jgi:UDP-2,3-diacylglucosamine hydrolase
VTDTTGRVVFIPDAHLRDPGDDDFRDMVAFLRDLKASLGPADTVVIMGDLFDFWVGFFYVVPYKFLPILSGLAALAQKGVTIHYTEGNHDFFMGPFFTDYLHAQVHPGPWELGHGAMRILVAHGDQVNRADRGYRFLRWILRCRPAAALRHVIPPFVLAALARTMSRASRAYTDAKTDDKERICREYAVGRFFEGYDAVVLGHFHRRDRWGMEIDGKRKTYLNVGCWMDGRDYVVLSGTEFRAMRRPGKASPRP